jgi:molecular chaperone GrpE
MRPEDESQGPVVRDRRRIDPTTGQVRNTGDASPQGGPAPAGGHARAGRHSVSRPGGQGGVGLAGRGGTGAGQGPAGGSQPPGDDAEQADTARQPEAAAEAATKLAERTADLQRLQAEYANYRKRVERDRMAVREQALANVLNELVPVLDDIGRAREHGELVGGFKSVADSLEGIAAKLGLTSFGEAGDPFDPTLHEALMHSYSPDVTEPTAVQILQPGYKVGERIIRPARVAVAEPGGDVAETSDGVLKPEATGSAEASGAAGDAGEPGDASDDTAG